MRACRDCIWFEETGIAYGDCHKDVYYPWDYPQTVRPGGLCKHWDSAELRPFPESIT